MICNFALNHWWTQVGNLPSAHMFEKAQQNCSLGCFCGRSNMIKCRLGVLPVLYKCVILHIGAPLHTAGALLLLLTLNILSPQVFQMFLFFISFFYREYALPRLVLQYPWQHHRHERLMYHHSLQFHLQYRPSHWPPSYMVLVPEQWIPNCI